MEKTWVVFTSHTPHQHPKHPSSLHRTGVSG